MFHDALVTFAERRIIKMKIIFISLIVFMFGILIGGIGVTKLFTPKILHKEKEIFKFKSYYDMTRQWIYIYQSGNKIEEILKTKKINSIAIYGMGDIGILLYEELKDSSISIEYMIDRNTLGRGYDIKIVTPTSKMKKVDAIIITPIFEFDEIRSMLEELVSYDIYALDDLIYEIG